MSEDEKLLLRGTRFDVVQREVPTRTGDRQVKEWLVHPGSVVILPLLDPDRVVLIKNRRFSIGRELWELPAGTRERGEDVGLCAARELTEETGYSAARLEPLLRFYPAPGLSDELMHAFVAHELTHGAQQLDDTEQIEVHVRSLSEALRMVREGEIEDAKSIGTLLYYSTFRLHGS